MRARTVLPYLAALILLAWILGSLSRSGTEGNGILAGSYWLVYIVYLIPLFALGGMVVMFLFLVLSWRVLSDALGFGIAARSRAKRKQSSTIQVLVWVSFWGIALGILFWRCGGLFCSANSTSIDQRLVNFTSAGGNSTGLSFPALLGSLATPVNLLADIVGSPVFALVFFGMLVVSTVILARGIIVSFKETRSGGFVSTRILEIGQVAVQEALELLKMNVEADARTRIMACYGRMIKAAASLGANVGPDRTARELEEGIRRTFELKGPGIRELTQLFEEARYSLHTITENDSQKAERSLEEIGKELHINTIAVDD